MIISIIEFAYKSSTPQRLEFALLRQEFHFSVSFSTRNQWDSTSLGVHPAGSSTPWEFHLLGVPLPWEFHSPGNSTALGVPLLWEFHCSESSTPLEFHSCGNSLMNPPVRVSQNSEPLTELSSTPCI